jgi:hypothetical protein
LSINNSNEWGHCFYSFHPGCTNFGVMVTRAGDELQRPD